MFCNCNDDHIRSDASVESEQNTLITNYLIENSIENAKLDESGIYSYPVIENPFGQPISGDIVSIYYSAKVMGAETYFQIHDREDGDPIKMKHGVDAIYPIGVDNALPLMKSGETFGFIFPSRLAYDTLNIEGLVPANSIVEFKIEVVSLHTESDILTEEISIIEDYINAAALNDLQLNPEELVTSVGPNNGVFFKNLKSGFGIFPNVGEVVQINYEGRHVGLDGLIFDDRYAEDPFEFTFGVGLLIEGLEYAIEEMSFGQEALIMVPSKLAYNESAAILPNFITDQVIAAKIVPGYVGKVAPYKPLIFELKLLNERD